MVFKWYREFFRCYRVVLINIIRIFCNQRCELFVLKCGCFVYVLMEGEYVRFRKRDFMCVYACRVVSDRDVRA